MKKNSSGQATTYAWYSNGPHQLRRHRATTHETESPRRSADARRAGIRQRLKPWPSIAKGPATGGGVKILTLVAMSLSGFSWEVFVIALIVPHDCRKSSIAGESQADGAPHPATT